MDPSEVLTTLILCGFMGALGQGVRAAIGLKSAATLAAQHPSQQTEFDVAYFTLSLMIGFTAGILAGFLLGLDKFAKIDPNDPKLLLAIVASGYAGTDFIENAAAFTNEGWVGGQRAANHVFLDGHEARTLALLISAYGRPATERVIEKLRRAAEL